MKILILGSSNSILKNGYFPTFYHKIAAQGGQLHNASVGASPGIQYAARCCEDLSIYDYVIFDSIANEENLGPFVGSFDYIKRLTFQIFSTIAAQTKLVVLGFCNERFAENPSAYYNMHKSIAQAVGDHFISAREYGNEHRNELPDGESLYQDGGAHLKVILAQQFGALLLQRIQSLDFNVGTAENFSRNFSTFDMSQTDCGDAVEKTNSLMARQFLMMYAGSTFNLARPAFAIGIYVDALNSSGYLRLGGAGATRDISLRYKPFDERFMLKFIPFKNGAHVKSMSVVATSENAERSIHDVDAPAQPNQFVTLEKLVCWTPSA